MIPVRLAALYRRSFKDPRRERLFLASLSFFFTFATARLVTQFAHDRGDRFMSLTIGDTHVHHLVWGIALLLLVGYLWLIQVGHGTDPDSANAGRFTAVLYGVGAALTLDEFALWLTLEDVYWQEEGRASVDAVTLFGALISVGFWGGPFLRLTGRQVMRLFRLVAARPARPRPGPSPATEPDSPTP